MSEFDIPHDDMRGEFRCPDLRGPLFIDPTLHERYTFIHASQVGDFNQVRMLLEDPNLDPTAYNNQAYHFAMHFKYHDIADLLMSDPRVMNSILRDGSHIIPLSPEEEHLKVKGWKKKNDFEDCAPLCETCQLGNKI